LHPDPGPRPQGDNPLTRRGKLSGVGAPFAHGGDVPQLPDGTVRELGLVPGLASPGDEGAGRV